MLTFFGILVSSADAYNLILGSGPKMDVASPAPALPHRPAITRCDIVLRISNTRSSMALILRQDSNAGSAAGFSEGSSTHAEATPAGLRRGEMAKRWI